MKFEEGTDQHLMLIITGSFLLMLFSHTPRNRNSSAAHQPHKITFQKANIHNIILIVNCSFIWAVQGLRLITGHGNQWYPLLNMKMKNRLAVSRKENASTWNTFLVLFVFLTINMMVDIVLVFVHIHVWFNMYPLHEFTKIFITKRFVWFFSTIWSFEEPISR